MKRILSIALCLFLVLSMSAISFADFDFSGMSLEELVALKDQINLAIWNSEDWQEVEVPQGIWEVGADIPAGKWDIKPLSGYVVSVEIGNSLTESGHIDDYVFSKFIISEERNSYDPASSVSSYTFNLLEGQFVSISDGVAVFAPYSGKPSLGFK